MMSTQNWNPNFMDLSPMFESFWHLKKYVANMQYWPEHIDLNNLNDHIKPTIIKAKTENQIAKQNKYLNHTDFKAHDSLWLRHS